MSAQGRFEKVAGRSDTRRTAQLRRVGGPPPGRNVLRSLVTEWLGAFPDDDLTLRAPKDNVSYVEGKTQRSQLRDDVDHYSLLGSIPRRSSRNHRSAQTRKRRRAGPDLLSAFIWDTPRRGPDRPGYIPIRGG